MGQCVLAPGGGGDSWGGAALCGHPGWTRARQLRRCAWKSYKIQHKYIYRSSEGPLEAGCTRNLEKNRRSGRTMKTRAISNGLAAHVATSGAPDLAGARMERAATDRAAVAGENPAGARVWEGGADGGADDCYHHCLGGGDGTRRPAQERQAGRAEGCRAGGEGTRADGRVWEVGSRNGHSPRPSAGEQAAQA